MTIHDELANTLGVVTGALLARAVVREGLRTPSYRDVIQSAAISAVVGDCVKPRIS